MLDLFSDHAKGLLSILYNQNHILVTIGISWFLIVLIRTLKTTYLKKFDISEEDNLASRKVYTCLLYTSPSPRDRQRSRMPSSA